MKLFLLLFLSVTQLLSNSIEHIMIGGYSYTTLQESYKYYDRQGEEIKLYKDEKNKDSASLLTFVLKENTGSCTGYGLEVGAFELQGDELVLYSSWERTGMADKSPFGAQIKRYLADNNASLRLVSSKVYIESSKRSESDESGMKYLYNEPKTKQETEKLQEYVGLIEKYYEGDFVFGEEAKNLVMEVKEALKPKNGSVWKKN